MAWQLAAVFALSFMAGFLLVALLAFVRDSDLALAPGPRWRDPERWLDSIQRRALQPAPSAVMAAWAPITSPPPAGSYWTARVAAREPDCAAPPSVLVEREYRKISEGNWERDCEGAKRK